nr:hypothetical protein [Asgard group archaeon]
MSFIKRKINLSNEWFKLLWILLGTIVVGVILFFINNFTGLLNVFLYVLQSIIGIVFGIWYIRIMIAYIRELRPKYQESHVGVPKLWAIYGIISSLVNAVVWGFLSALIFNFPKIYFLIPTSLAMVEVFYVFIKGNRRKIRDWFIITFNCLSFLYLFIWTLIDFGVDLPNVLGVFAHTITSSSMWWQIIFVNTGAFFVPTFMFPIYMLNPRYYFAIPVTEYYALKEAAKGEEKTAFLSEEEEYQQRYLTEQDDEEHFIGDRKPFFEERMKAKERSEEIDAIQREMERSNLEDDLKYAQYVGSNDFAFQFRNILNRFDSFLRIISLSIVLILIVFTPVVFAGNISLNVIPNYQKQNYTPNPNMVLAIKGNIFSTYDAVGNITNDWQLELNKEIAWAKQLHATHIRYDITSIALGNSLTKTRLATGFQIIKNNGLKLIINVDATYIYTKKALINGIYNYSQYIAQSFEPDYMIIYNEINGKLTSYLSEQTTYQDWIPQIYNVSNMIKSISPNTKVVSTVLTVSDGLPVFEELLTNSTLNLDAVGVVFYPVYFGWRLNKLREFADLYGSVVT